MDSLATVFFWFPCGFRGHRCGWYCSVLRGVIFLAGLTSVTTVAGAAPAVSFQRAIRPLLAAKCLSCHGPDEGHREAGLRLDVREEAIAAGALEPGDPDASELIRRVFSDDPAEQMPPVEVGKPLTGQQRQLLREWIREGAEYEPHWAFVPPVRPLLPEVARKEWPRNEIDYFVLAGLEATGLRPSPAADRVALVRRVHLDLIGLPPTPEQADAFVQDEDPRAYEKLVDRLLDSQQYGERWARQWLDLARYADTNGYEKDRERSTWPYRDWVIRALNADMPFDEFTVAQLAGDMLPDATADQIIATGFHRNTMLNEEGGIDPLEYRYYAMVDRVATTGTVWLGLSIGCAQCHSHKYDPIAHEEYYGFMALLNNTEEPDYLVREPQILRRRAEIEGQITALEAALPGQFPPAAGEGPVERRRSANLEASFQRWLVVQRSAARPWKVLVPDELETNLPRLEVLDDGSIFSTGDITKRDVFRLRFRLDESRLPISALRLEALPDERLPAGGPGRAYYEGRKGDFFLSELRARVDGEPVRFASASHDYGRIAVGSGDAKAENVFDGDGSTGWSTAQGEGRPHQLVLNLDEVIERAGELEIELLFERHFAASLGRFRFSVVAGGEPAQVTGLPVALDTLLARPESPMSEEDLAELRRYFLRVAPELSEARRPIDALRAQLPDFPTTMVMQERAAAHPRKTYRHHRGEYLSPREEVAPGVPRFLAGGSVPPPQNRLELARWLVSADNPLVGRVTVNRAWQAIFGTGLHRTSDDFGTQAEPPVQRELLDWLACDFVENGWSMKRLHRLIVTSATYRQSSRVTAELLQADPQNERLARGPRFRVEAEVLRDTMLHAGGLLSDRMYGPPVRPPQPASVTAVAYGSPPWEAATDDDRYRRSIYTFAKRTTPFAAYAVFDAPSGETCVALRNRSNTPLQALTLLNDEMYLESARQLARWAAARHASEEEIAQAMFRRLLTRPPRADERQAMLRFYRLQLSRLRAGDLQAEAVAGQTAAGPELAAWTMVARALMNLDEAITKS